MSAAVFHVATQHRPGARWALVRVFTERAEADALAAEFTAKGYFARVFRIGGA